MDIVAIYAMGFWGVDEHWIAEMVSSWGKAWGIQKGLILCEFSD